MASIDRVSFIISTSGKRDFIQRTLESCREQGSKFEDHEVIVVGETRHLPKLLPHQVKVHPIPLSGLPVNVYLWKDGIERAKFDWVAMTADDGVWRDDWGDRVRTYANPPPIIKGQSVESTGKRHKKRAMMTRSIIGIFRRDIFDQFPLDRRWGEDARWCQKVNAARVPQKFDRDLVWYHHGNPKGLGSTQQPMYQFGQAHIAEPLPLPLKNLKLIPSIRGIIGVFENGKHVGAFKAARLPELLAPGPDGLEERILAVSKRKMRMPLAIYIDTTEPARLAAARLVIVAHPQAADALTFPADILTRNGLPTIVLGQRGPGDRVDDRIVSWMAYPDAHLDASKTWIWEVSDQKPWLDHIPHLLMGTQNLASMPAEECAALIEALLHATDLSVSRPLIPSAPMQPTVNDGVVGLVGRPPEGAAPEIRGAPTRQP